MKSRKIYAALIDYKSAFSEVNHDLLWCKLFNQGISAKVNNLFRKIYSQATVQIRVEELTEPRNVTKGVLQADSASPY